MAIVDCRGPLVNKVSIRASGRRNKYFSYSYGRLSK